jgi:hypothetical protein
VGENGKGGGGGREISKQEYNPGKMTKAERYGEDRYYIQVREDRELEILQEVEEDVRTEVGINSRNLCVCVCVCV